MVHRNPPASRFEVSLHYSVLHMEVLKRGAPELYFPFSTLNFISSAREAGQTYCILLAIHSPALQVYLAADSYRGGFL